MAQEPVDHPCPPSHTLSGPHSTALGQLVSPVRDPSPGADSPDPDRDRPLPGPSRSRPVPPNPSPVCSDQVLRVPGPLRPPCRRVALSNERIVSLAHYQPSIEMRHRHRPLSRLSAGRVHVSAMLPSAPLPSRRPPTAALLPLEGLRRRRSLEGDEPSGGGIHRRFLMHVVPEGFVRIRHFGLLANRTRTARLARYRQVASSPSPPRHKSFSPHPVDSASANMLSPTNPKFPPTVAGK
jgi:putative transposase